MSNHSIEHTLGRVPLSGEHDVEFVETSESEDDDLSDHDAQVVTTPKRRRSNQNRTTIITPSREKNMSSSSASRRFRRTSTKPQTGQAQQHTLWQAREDAVVDQSVNLMDSKTLPYDPEAGSTRGVPRARMGMMGLGNSSMRQSMGKSMVDIFLSEDQVQSRGSGKGNSVDDLSAARTRKCRNLLLIVLALIFIVVLAVFSPFGLLASLKSDDNNDKDESTTIIRPPQELFQETTPTKAPTDAPQPQEELLIEEETQVQVPQENVDRPLPEPQVPVTEEDEDDDVLPIDDALQIEEVPQNTRFDAFYFYVIDQDVSEQEQLDIMGSPAKKALHWIAQTDPAYMEIPGLDEVATTNMVAEHALLQRYALAVFYYSMQDASTSTTGGNAGRLLQQDEDLARREAFDNGWLSAEPICGWTGVVCDDDYESVLKIALPKHLLQGTIPREIVTGGAMPYLNHLDLSDNQLQGTLPKATPERDGAGSGLGVTPPASKLKLLDLTGNRLTGSLDNLIGYPQLIATKLGRNQFSGKLPDEIKDLRLLEELFLSDNKLTGAVPAESLGKLTDLKSLRLDGNSFTEELPMALYTLTHLKDLRLSSNGFTGKIPESYGALVNLHFLHLDGNRLVGKVPTQLGQLADLRELQLDGNLLTGNMPSQVCELTDGGPLSLLETDCADGEIVCDCCSECFRL